MKATPKKFTCKVTVQTKSGPNKAPCQEQCSSGQGGNGKCGAAK